MSSTTKRPRTEAASEGDASTEDIVLQLLCTNDTHSQMLPFKAAVGTEKGTEVGGLARRAALFETMRSTCPGSTITLDAGDCLVGTPFFEFLNGEADLVALHELGYDAIAIGNHDFDGSDADTSGLKYFKKLAARHAPDMHVLCDNVVDAATGERVFAGHVVFEQPSGIRVGVAAVLGPQAWEVTATSSRAGLRFEEYERAAREASAELRRQRCDVLVCLSHTGVDRGDRQLMRLGLFDIVFSGHAHYFDALDALECIDGDGGRLGLLSPGFALGGGVSWVKLTLDRTTRRVKSHASGITPVSASAGELAPVVERVAGWSEMFEVKCREEVGRAAEALPLPDKQDQLDTYSAVHAALSRGERRDSNSPITPILSSHCTAVILTLR